MTRYRNEDGCEGCGRLSWVELDDTGTVAVCRTEECVNFNHRLYEKGEAGDNGHLEV